MSPISTTVPAAASNLKWIRLLVLINFGLVVLQAVSAGLVMSGSGPAILLHARGGLALGLGALFQVVAAAILWARRRALGWIVRSALILFVVVVLQIVAGHTKRYWFHVPIAVGLFGGLLLQQRRLDAQTADSGTLVKKINQLS